MFSLAFTSISQLLPAFPQDAIYGTVHLSFRKKTRSFAITDDRTSALLTLYFFSPDETLKRLLDLQFTETIL